MEDDQSRWKHPAALATGLLSSGENGQGDSREVRIRHANES